VKIKITRNVGREIGDGRVAVCVCREIRSASSIRSIVGKSLRFSDRASLWTRSLAILEASRGARRNGWNERDKTRRALSDEGSARVLLAALPQQRSTFRLSLTRCFR